MPAAAFGQSAGNFLRPPLEGAAAPPHLTGTAHPAPETDLTTLMLVLGLIGLFFGGDWLVRGASGIAAAFRVPTLIIGLTIVGFGTSTPELMVSLDAALTGKPGIAIGNVVGSNIANILLILGLSALVGVISAPFAGLRRDLRWMAAAAVVLLPVFWDGTVSRIEGGLMTAAIIIYIVLALRRPGPLAELEVIAPPLWRSALFTAAGLGLVLIGAHLLVESASEIARAYGISEAAIGLTIVAVGTSLPELATSLVAAFRGQRDIAIGNVIGSNIFNILAILGLTALITPIPVEPRFLATDVPVMLAVTAALIVLLWWRAGVGRLSALGLVAAYAAYIGLTGST